MKTSKYITLHGFYVADGVSKDLFQRKEAAEVTVDENNKIVNFIVKPYDISTIEMQRLADKFNDKQNEEYENTGSR